MRHCTDIGQQKTVLEIKLIATTRYILEGEHWILLFARQIMMVLQNHI